MPEPKITNFISVREGWEVRTTEDNENVRYPVIGIALIISTNGPTMSYLQAVVLDGSGVLVPSDGIGDTPHQNTVVLTGKDDACEIVGTPNVRWLE
jgi:hypothetical protein